MSHYEIICPLFGFQIQDVIMYGPELSHADALNLLKQREEKLNQGFELSNGLKLRKISAKDLKDFSAPFFSFFNRAFDFRAVRFVLEKDSETNAFDGNTRQTFLRTALALRLLKKGYISGSLIYSVLISEKERRVSSSSMEEVPRLFRFSASDYFLEIEEIATLDELLKKLQNVDFQERGAFYLAIKRFNRAYEEDDDEDRLVDFMISLEALFLKGDKGGPTPGKIIATACSTLIGKNNKERENIKSMLLEAYKKRNSIVHGAPCKRLRKDKKTGLVFDTLPELVSQVEEVLRESIKRMLD